MSVATDIEIVTGTEIEIPLNRLKTSPHNARKVPHTEAAIEALAASIAAKKMLQKPVVEPERDEAGGLTGFWLVTIGEGRRLALCLLARRKQIKKTHPVACVIDTEFDPGEISLDENVTRSAMHPADQFEAFRDLAQRKGWGAEEIGARFGVSAHVVRQRLRLGAVSPRLMAVYREDGLTLDQLMAFAVTEDHARQEQVYDGLSYNRSAGFIRHAMTQAKIAADDRRAIFVGVEAYAVAGGEVVRDLFTEDGGGWWEDVALADRLAAEKLAALAQAVREAEGWKWAEAHLDYPSAHGLARVYPHRVERTPQEVVDAEAMSAEYDAQIEKFADVDELPPEVEARLKEIEAALEAFGDAYAYAPDELARGGVFVTLGHDGAARIERGFIRSEDVAPDPEPEAEAGDGAGGGAEPEPEPEAEPQEAEEPDGLTPLSDRLVADLTAYRTASLRDALADRPEWPSWRWSMPWCCGSSTPAPTPPAWISGWRRAAWAATRRASRTARPAAGSTRGRRPGRVSSRKLRTRSGALSRGSTPTAAWRSSPTASDFRRMRCGAGRAGRWRWPRPTPWRRRSVST
jgi:ParB family chromosome partitioning protein